MVHSFLWKVAHARLMTNEARQKINMTDDNSGPRCQHGPEFMMHVLRDCDEAMEFLVPLIIKPNYLLG
jgi:hypothetical protein